VAEAAVERLAYRIVGDPEVNARKITMGFMLEMRESTVCERDWRLVSPAREMARGACQLIRAYAHSSIARARGRRCVEQQVVTLVTRRAVSGTWAAVNGHRSPCRRYR
jgi:hypothetical protein